MFNPLTVPYGVKMMYNVVKLKPSYTIEDAEQAIGDMCNVVKNTYADDGFRGGQVWSYAGFVSEEGSTDPQPEASHLAILTFWDSFEQHERSHADTAFKERFDALLEMTEETFELGYDMLWQGEPE